MTEFTDPILNTELSIGNNDETAPPQLNRLSRALSGFRLGGRQKRRHTQDAIRAIRSGTYTIDPLQLSRRIVREALDIG